MVSGCGGTHDTVMSATLTDAGCVYRGDTAVEAGTFTISVDNETDHEANFVLARLADGYTSATIQPVLAKETAWVRSLSAKELSGIERGQAPTAHPRPDLATIFDFNHGGSATEIGAGETSELPGGDPGSFAVICQNLTDVGKLPRQQFVATGISVTGSRPGVTTAGS